MPWLLGMIIFGALGVIMSRLSDKPAASQPVPAPVTVQPTPAATPIPAPVQQLPPVGSPAPRAQLVKLPEWKIDDSHLIWMPYGMQVLAALRGYLGTEAQLPREGHVGDMWVVGSTPWVWITVPGTGRPTWVDP
jgi:hypothetical protein